MDALVLAVVVAIISIIAYRMIKDHQADRAKKKPAPKTEDQLYKDAMHWIENFRTASYGLNTRKDLDTYVKEHALQISTYSHYYEFERRYQEIYKKVLDKINKA
jgi:hypothetical protein